LAQVGKVIAGAALVAGAITLDVVTGGSAAALTASEFSALLTIMGSTGVSLLTGGIAGILKGTPPGRGVSSQNPIQPWNIAYGQVLVGGTFAYIESNGGILSNGSNTYNKCNNQVIILAAHPIKSVDQVRLNGKPIQLGPGGSGAQNTTWSYSPSTNQNQTNITSISRSGEVVTIKLSAPIAGQNGLQLRIQNVADYSFNGTFTVTQPNPSDDTTFTYLCGGPDTSSSGGYVLTCYPDYKNRVHCDLTSCLGNHTSTFPELLSTSSLWTAAHKNLGKASVYIAYYYDDNVFANGLPTSSFVISGKADIYDPRLGDISNPAAHVYTNNAALVIADYLSNKTWGYGLEYGSDIPLAALIQAANICDEEISLAAGGTEKRYTINMNSTLDRSRGEILQDMLGACQGRITIQSGQYIIVPGAWVGPSLSLNQKNLIGPIEYKPILTIGESCNGVKGTYTSPVTGWQPADIPPYAEDEDHKFDSDRWLEADGGQRIWKDVSFPATTSPATAQRLAKIELERTRREGRLTLHCDMSAYSAVAMDVIEFTYPRYGWVNKTFEVLSSQLVSQAGANGEPPTLGVDLELAETDSTVYDFSVAEEMTPADTPSPAIDTGQIVNGPQFLEIESGPTTAYVGSDGLAIPRIFCFWQAGPDITSGGTIRIEYQKVGDTFWIPAGTISGDQTSCYITGVVAGEQYNVQVQGFRASGAGSGWQQAGPITVSSTATSLSASSVTYPDGTPVSGLQTLAYAGISNNLIPNGNFLLGTDQGWLKVGDVTFDSTPQLFVPPGATIWSPTFAVQPGNKYRFIIDAQSTSQPSPGGHRIMKASRYSPNIVDFTPISGFIGTDELASVTVSTRNSFTYDWVCPDGCYFVSLVAFNASSAPSSVAYFKMIAQDYSASAQWGADRTVENTAGNTLLVGDRSASDVSSTVLAGGGIDFNNPGNANQGDLSKVDKANTVNIVAGAVNSNILYQSTLLQFVSGGEQAIGQATITTGGGYVKVTLVAYLASSNTTFLPTVNLRKGGATGTVMSVAPHANVATSGYSTVALSIVDASPDPIQQYTVTVLPGASETITCQYVSLIVENAKV